MELILNVFGKINIKVLIFTLLLLFFVIFYSSAAEAFLLTSSSPTNGATNVARNTTIRLAFDDSLNPGTVDNVVICDRLGNRVNYTSSYTYPNAYAVYTPRSSLSYQTLYTVDFSTIRSSGELTPSRTTTISFETVAAPVISSTNPSNRSTGVSRSQAIRVTFNMVYDAASLPASPLTNSNTTARVVGAWAYTSTTTATFTPSSNLDYNANYSMELAGTTFNTGRETLTGTTSFTFTTINTPANISVTVSPSSVSVASDQPIVAPTYTFTETTGQNVTINSSTASYLNSNGVIVYQENVPASFTIYSGQRTNYSENITIPSRVISQIADGALTLRRYFTGVDAGRNSVTVSTDIAVTLTSNLGATFSITKITIDTPINLVLFKQNSDFSARAFVQGAGSGTIEGYWYMDDIPLDYFKINMTNGVTIQVLTRNKLFTTNYGDHKLWIKLINPNAISSNTIYYSISDISTNLALLNTPSQGKTFNAGDDPPTFTWSSVPQSIGYKIAIAANSNEFDSANWQFTEKNSWTPSKDYWKNLAPGMYYWAVKVIGLDRKESALSRVFYFRIIKKENSAQKARDDLLAYNAGKNLPNFLLKRLSLINNSDESFTSQYDNQEEGAKLFQGSMNSNFLSSEPFNTRTPLYNRNYNLTLNQPLDKGNFSFTGNWANNPDNYYVGTQVTDYNFNVNYGKLNAAFGNLSFDNSEFSLYSQYKLGTSASFEVGNGKIHLKRIFDNGQNALYQTNSAKITEMTSWMYEPFKTSGEDFLKIIYFKGKQTPDLESPDAYYVKPQDSKVTSVYAQKAFFKDKVKIGGEYCRGHYDTDYTDTNLPKIDNAIKAYLTANLDNLEFGSRYRCIGTNFGTLGNPYLEKDQCLFENSIGYKFCPEMRAKYLFGKTFNDLNGDLTIVGAYSLNNQFNIDITPPMKKGWPTSLSWNRTFNLVNSEATAFSNESLTETITDSWTMSYPVTEKISLYLGHMFTRYNDLSDQNDDTSTNAFNLGGNIAIGKKMNITCNYSGNINRNLTTSADNQFSSMYLQSDYKFIPEKFWTNLTYSKNLSDSAFSKNNTDIMNWRFNYRLKARVFNCVDYYVLTLEYKYKGITDYFNQELNYGYGNVVFQISNLFNF